MFFNPIVINRIIYIDSGFGENNPLELALKHLETAKSPFNKIINIVKELGYFVSLGIRRPIHEYNRLGISKYIKPNSIKIIEDAVRLVIAITTNYYKKHLAVRDW
jgi:hypothetical protein